MKCSNTSERLKFLMKERNLKQVDILNAAEPFCRQYDVKLNKSDLSQYVSGKVEPGQDKLFILGRALNVSEAWLMGFDDSIERKKRLVLRKKDDFNSDKVIRLICNIDSSLYHTLTILAEEHGRTLEDELEYQLYGAIQNQIDNQSFYQD